MREGLDEQLCLTVPCIPQILWVGQAECAVPLCWLPAPGMRAVRRRAIERATSARRWCLVLGTLGRQGNPHILHMLQVRHLTQVQLAGSWRHIVVCIRVLITSALPAAALSCIVGVHCHATPG